MQAKDIEPGTAYWHDSSNNWRDYTGHDAYPVVITDTTTRWRRPSFSSVWHQDPNGKHLIGRIPEDADHPRAGKPVYVRPQALRAPLAEAEAERRARAEQRQADGAQRAAARQATSDAAEALYARLSALELPGHLVHPGTANAGTSVLLELTAAQANALVGILGSAEARFQAGYEEGRRDAEAERRQQLGYISVEEEAERDRAVAGREAAKRCPAGTGCSGAAFPGHPAHPQLGLPDDALPDADERALQRGLGHR